MRRVFFVLVLVFTSLAGVAGVAGTPVSAGSDDLPNAPQAKSGGLEFSIESVIRGDSFGAPLDFAKDDEGREYVLVAIRVENTGDSEQNLVSDKFAFVNGDDLVGSSGDTCSRVQDAVGLRAMGDTVGFKLKPGVTQVFALGWRLSADLDKLTLNIDYDGAKRIDLTPWVEQDIDADEFRPANVAPFITEDGSFVLGDTLGREDDDTQLTATGYQYLDGIDLGFEYLTPRGKYVVVSLTLFVPGRESRTFSADDLHLYSASTDQFTDYDFDATLYYNQAGNSLIFEDLQPGVTYEGNIIFDVPLEGADFWLAVGNNTDEPLSAIHLDTAATTGSSDGAAADDDLITDCAQFDDYDEAQAYYADNPEAQIYIDPDIDGLACEVFFGRG